MAESGERGGAGRARRGPAPIASFDHDGSDEVRQPSSPEQKQTFQLPEIREDLSAAGPSGETASSSAGPVGVKETGGSLAVKETGENRARSHSTPGLITPAAPRIDISRASSSSHQDSRDSSPELALFAGADPDRAPDHLGFREDGALELRSSTEELAFLEPEPPPAPPPAPPPGPSGSISRRHSRKDSQGSEAALLAISGRTSRLSSIGSQCSAHSATSALSHVSHVSRLSVVSGTSRSPSPHKMLLETSFCGPKPIETDPEVCAAAVEERFLGIAKKDAPPPVQINVQTETTVAIQPPVPDARDKREVRTEARVEVARPQKPAPAPEPPSVAIIPPSADTEKHEKETRNRRPRSRDRRDRTEPEVFQKRNRSKDVIRIKLKPSEDYDDDDDDDEEESDCTLVARKPDSLSLGGKARPAPAPARSPSPAPPAHSRKSSFCSLFKSRETIGSPDSPSEAVRRKKSASEGRSRSKSRERTVTPASAGKVRGSVLALFKNPRRSGAASPSPPSRAASPAPAVPVAPAAPPPPALRHLKYYEDTRDGIIHIPLRTPPDEDKANADDRRSQPPCSSEVRVEVARPASAPCTRPGPTVPAIPRTRQELPDGSIIIPLHSPTEKEPQVDLRHQVAAVVENPPSTSQQRTSDHSERKTSDHSERRTSDHSERRTADHSEPRTSVRSERKKSTSESDRSQTPSAVASPPMAAVTPATPAESIAATPEPARSRRKERIIFTTHVGSTEQVFSTQFSITKTPSVTSEISESFPSLPDEPRTAPSCPVLRDTHISSETESLEIGVENVKEVENASSSRERDSSSEGSSETGMSGITGRGKLEVAEVEARGLVVQESFEEELPFVPTTLPLERSLALPMLPVRERGPQISTTASVERPRSGVARAPLPPPPPPPTTVAPPPPPQERLRIRLPRRASSAATTDAAARRPSRSRTRSGSDARKTDWIDFSEVPERRPAAKRIQTLPTRAAEEGGFVAISGGEVAISYVEPDQCRCECHRSASPNPHSSPEEDNSTLEAAVAVCVSVSGGSGGVGGARGADPPPFTADLDVHDPSSPS